VFAPNHEFKANQKQAQADFDNEEAVVAAQHRADCAKAALELRDKFANEVFVEAQKRMAALDKQVRKRGREEVEDMSGGLANVQKVQKQDPGAPAEEAPATAPMEEAPAEEAPATAAEAAEEPAEEAPAEEAPAEEAPAPAPAEEAGEPAEPAGEPAGRAKASAGKAKAPAGKPKQTDAEKAAAKARVAEEKKAEKARVAEEKKAEKARAAEEKKAEKARAAEEKKAEKARAAEEKKANGKKKGAPATSAGSAAAPGAVARPKGGKAAKAGPVSARQYWQGLLSTKTQYAQETRAAQDKGGEAWAKWHKNMQAWSTDAWNRVPENQKKWLAKKAQSGAGDGGGADKKKD